MKRKILTAILSTALMFLMVVGSSAQVSSAEKEYLVNASVVENAQEAKGLLKTQIIANVESSSVNEANATLVEKNVTEAELYNEVYRLIYREQMPVREAFITAYDNLSLTTSDDNDVSALFKDLVDALGI